MEHYHIRIANDQVAFSAAHFLVVDGAPIEPLHGHDYRVAAKIFAPLDQNHCVVDFVALQEILTGILSELDHHVLLPLENSALRIGMEKGDVEVTWNDRRWVFPRSECCLLEMPNTTTELLARWIAQRLVDALAERTGARPQSVQITVTEGRGWAASCTIDH